MLANTRCELAGETATPILPSAPLGIPGLKVSSFHVSPPSVLFHRPLRPLPASMPHGIRWNFHMAAYRTRGLFTSSERSIAPVLSLRKSTFFQLLPPSVVRNTPRSGLGPKA